MKNFWKSSNKDTIEETAYNWDLPVDAIEEVISYCQTHQELLAQEASLNSRENFSPLFNFT